MSQHSQFGPRPRIATTKPACPEFGDIRDELGKVDGCTCEPARRGYYSGAIMYNCPVHQDEYRRITRPTDHRKTWFSIPTPKEKWVYQGAAVALGYGEEVEGKRCYWFRRETLGVGGTTMMIPIDEYWATCSARNGAPCT